jgi:NADPH:quinone reductase-like Zn-dependent oxidoreductase
MKAMRVNDSLGGPVLIEDEMPQPRPGPGEVLIRVCAAGVTTTELQWYPTSHRKNGEPRQGAVPGHEFSGVIEDTGQEVFGMNDWFVDGALAEYCVAPRSSVIPKPKGLTHAEAASVPIGALTAWQGLFDRAKLQSGERVLVHGGAGAVGVFVIQLARMRGAYVIATAAARNREFLAGLGADQVLDYRTDRFEDIRNADVIFDTVGGATLERSWNVLSPGGRMVTIVSEAEGSREDRVKAAFFIVEPNQKQLSEVAALLESGGLRAVVDTVIPLSRAADAYSGKVQRSGRGKLVVEVSKG